MRKSDFILIAAVVILAAAIFFIIEIKGTEGKKLIVTRDGEEIDTILLPANDSFRYEDETGYNTVTVSGFKVNVTSADCKSQICVKHKYISKSGETICCVPHKLVIRIE